MLHDFLTSNRKELIKRCKEKVARRFAPAKTPVAISRGVPMFLQQLVYVLKEEESTRFSQTTELSQAPSSTGIGRTAALHGAELLSLGFSIDQVVHEYGDVCQSVTELAVERNESIRTDEFRVLNRCLDNAIADAVGSYGIASKTASSWQAIDLKDRMAIFATEYRRLVNVALQSLAAIQTGSVGLNGATGSLLARTLNELRYLGEKGIPEIPLQSPTERSTDGAANE